jgi:lysophospholipase L1-like esterase
VPPVEKDHLRVVIAGDSITDGPWPVYMSSMFNGKTYNNRQVEIGNFGCSGASICVGHEKNPDFKQYSQTKNWMQMIQSTPDVIVFMLGSNDAKGHTWN